MNNAMDVKTHCSVSTRLVGIPLKVIDGVSATVNLITVKEMVVDTSELVHGGFIFGLADYAAMLAVNHPNVVLGSAQSMFIAPVRVGDVMVAEAAVTKTEGRKSEVKVDVKVNDTKVFTGTFICYILKKHIFAK